MLEIIVQTGPSGWMDCDKAFFCRANLRLSSLADLTVHTVDAIKARRLIADLEGEVMHTYNPRKMISAGHLLHECRYLGRLALGAVYCDLARVALALERHWLAHGVWPKTLAELVPHYLPAVPNDVTTGSPLRYHPGPGQGFTLYSLGWNGLDEGGHWSTKPGPDGRGRDYDEGDWSWPQPAAKQEDR